MPKITFTESQRLDILDCLPDEESREAYWADLEYHSRLSPVWEKMWVGNKKPFAQDVFDKIDAWKRSPFPWKYPLRSWPGRTWRMNTRPFR